MLNTEAYLLELQRERDLEALRDVITRLGLFGRNKDPRTAPIREAELKELVKHYNIHRQRGFWRDHPEKQDLVRAVHQYLAKKQDRPGPAAGAAPLVPVPPAAGLRRAASAQPPPRAARLRLKKAYSGDLFGQHGPYDAGMIYRSRMAPGSSEAPPPSHLPPVAESVPKEEVAVVSTAVPATDHEAQAEVAKRRQCAKALHSISLRPGDELQMASEGGVRTLSRLAGSTDDDALVGMYASAALANLTAADDPRAVARVLDDGLIQAVSKLASRSAHPVTCFNCAYALARLTTLTPRCEAAGVVLLALARAAEADGDLPTTELALRGVNNLVLLTGALPAGLVDLLGRVAEGTDAAARTTAARMLLSLSTHPLNRIKVVDDQGLEVLLRLLRARVHPAAVGSGLSSRAHTPADDPPLADIEPEVVDLAAQACLNLCSVRSSQSTRQSVLALALRLVDSHARAAAVALAHATSNDDALCAAVAHNDALLRRLAAVAREPGADLPAATAAAAALRNVASRPALLPRVAGEPACVAALIALLQNTTRGPHQEIAAQTLCVCVGMGSSSTGGDGDGDTAVVDAFVGLGNSTSPPLQHACCLALLNLSAASPAMREQLAAGGALRTLVALCPRVAPATRALCLGAICNLCPLVPVDADELQLPRLLAAQSAEHPAAVRALYALSFAHGEALVRAGAVACLVQASEAALRQRTDDEPLTDALRLTSGALCNLGQPEAVPTLQRLLGAVSDAETALRCAVALAKLAAGSGGDVELQPAVLVAAMRSGNVVVQRFLAEALANCDERASWPPAVVKDFVVVALLRINEPATRLNCARALNNLLCAPGRDMAALLELGVLYSLIKLGKQGDEERALCVAAVERLAAEHADVVVQNGALPVLSAWGAHTALALVAQHAKHLPALVAAGLPLASDEQAVAGTLRNVAWDPAVRASALHSPRRVQQLVAAAKGGLAEAVEALEELTADEAAHRLLAEHGAIEVLGARGLHNLAVGLRGDPGDAYERMMPAIPSLPAGVLCLLAQAHELGPRLVEAGAVTALAALPPATSLTAAADVVLALLHLSVAAPDAATAQRMVDEGALQAAAQALSLLPTGAPPAAALKAVGSFRGTPQISSLGRKKRVNSKSEQQQKKSEVDRRGIVRSYAVLARNLSRAQGAAAALDAALLQQIAGDALVPADAARNVAFASLNVAADPAAALLADTLVALAESHDRDTAQLATLAASAAAGSSAGLVHTLTALMDLEVTDMERLRAEALEPVADVPCERAWTRLDVPAAAPEPPFRLPFEPSPWAVQRAEPQEAPALAAADVIPAAPVTATAEGAGGDEPVGDFVELAVPSEKLRVDPKRAAAPVAVPRVVVGPGTLSGRRGLASPRSDSVDSASDCSSPRSFSLEEVRGVERVA